MAVTKIWDIKGKLENPIEYITNKEKTENPKFVDPLESAINYTTNGTKTEKQYYVTGLNCNTTYAKDQFNNVKKRFGKTNGILAFHAYQSFSNKDNITPDKAHEIGVKLAEILWGEKYQVLVSTHLNTKCLHNHFLINSVSFVDGKKYHDCRSAYKNMQDKSDELCLEYGLSVVEKLGKGSEPVYVAQATKDGMPTRYNIVKEAIDEAINNSANMREFELNLRKLGFKTQFNPRRKYWTVTPVGWNKPVRLARLGMEYTNESIVDRVLNSPNRVQFRDFHKGEQKRQYLLITRGDKLKKKKGLKGLYLRYCYELGYLPKYKQNPIRVHNLLKDDILKCEKYTNQIRLLGKYDINTEKELSDFLLDRKEEIEKLNEKREDLRNFVRRKIPLKEKELAKEDIGIINDKLKELREEVKLAEGIKENSKRMEERLEVIESEREKEGRKR